MLDKVCLITTNKAILFRIVPRVALATLLLLVLASCRIELEDKELELAKEIPQYPGSMYLSSFETGLPDGVPGAGVNYLSDDAPEDIFDFFHQHVAQAGWTVVEVYDYADEAVPKQLVMEKSKWRCRILIINEEPRRINIKVERK